MSETISTQENQPSPEYLASVLSVTREQLSRSMGVCAELEALLNLERSKNEQYEAQIANLQAQLAQSNSTADTKK